MVVLARNENVDDRRRSAMNGGPPERSASKRRSKMPLDAVAEANRRSGRPVAASRPRRGSSTSAVNGEGGRAGGGGGSGEYRAPALGPLKDPAKRTMVASTPNVMRERRERDREREQGRLMDEERARQRERDRRRRERRREEEKWAAEPEAKRRSAPVASPRSHSGSEKGGSRARSPDPPVEEKKDQRPSGLAAMSAALGSYIRRPKNEQNGTADSDPDERVEHTPKSPRSNASLPLSRSDSAASAASAASSATPRQGSRRNGDSAIATDSETDDMVSAASEADLSETEDSFTSPEPSPEASEAVSAAAPPTKRKNLNRARFADELESHEDVRRGRRRSLDDAGSERGLEKGGRTGSDAEAERPRSRRSVDFDLDGNGRPSLDEENERRHSGESGRRESLDEGRHRRRSLDGAERGERGEKVERGEKGEKLRKKNPKAATMGQGEMPRKYKMSGVSNMLLLMEDKSYHPSCFSVYSFHQSLPYDSAYEFFETLAENYPKYLYRVTNRGKTFGPAKWEVCPDFDVGENIEEVEMEDGRNGEEDFFRLMGKFIGRRYDYDRPPWEAMLVQNMRLKDGSRSALAIKIHHCFSDGQGMIMSYHTTIQAIAKKEDVSAIQRSFDSKAKDNPRLRPFRRLYPGTALHAFHDAFRVFWSPGRKEFTYTDKKRKRSAGRLYFHSKGIRLAAIKMIREAIKGVKGGNNISLNDVATALVTRAARRAAEKRARDDNRRIKDKRFCLLIPISIRPKGKWELENYSTGSLAWFDFRPDQECGFEEALLQAHKEMKIIKNSRLHDIALWWFNALYKHPWTFPPNWRIARPLYYKIFEQYHVATNVPGPPKKVAFGGIEAQSYQVLPPSSAGKATMAIGMISYADEFKIAVSCDDEEALRELPRQMCEAFEEVANEWIREAQNRLEKHTEGA